MRDIREIVFHCTATSQDTKVSNIIKYWKERLGWKSPGYHFIIETSGKVTQLHPLDKPSNGVRGHNANSIHISYIGGKDVDDRTPSQKTSQKALLIGLLGAYPNAKVMGHRDYDGVTKSCPRCDAKDILL